MVFVSIHIPDQPILFPTIFLLVTTFYRPFPHWLFPYFIHSSLGYFFSQPLLLPSVPAFQRPAFIPCYGVIFLREITFFETVVTLENTIFQCKLRRNGLRSSAVPNIKQCFAAIAAERAIFKSDVSAAHPLHAAGAAVPDHGILNRQIAAVTGDSYQSAAIDVTSCQPDIL